MLIVAPDFDRRIELPGAGPCPRPVDVDRSKTGFARLVSLRVYSFAAGKVIDGEAEEDEVFIVLMRGQAAIEVSQAGARVGTYALDEIGGDRAVYLPPHAAYRLTAIAGCDIAYARVVPPVPAVPAPRAFAPDGDRLAVPDHAAGMEMLLAPVSSGERLALTDSAGRSPERFVHVRANAGAAATIGAGQIGAGQIGDWASVILSEGEVALCEGKEGSVDILTISATSR